MPANTANYIEHEIKVLEIDVEMVRTKLEKLGALKVYDGKREATYFDNVQGDYAKSKISIRLTEEGKLKLSGTSVDKDKNIKVVKVFTSRKQETLDFLAILGLFPIAIVKSHRISYEWSNVDFDIDQFPGIPAFMEVDIENLPIPQHELLAKLGLTDNKIRQIGTPEVFNEYDINYWEKFKV